MTEKSPLDFRNTKLDTDQFSAPFSVETNWCVITGAPCSGKTTMINLLAQKGYRTVPEAGRKFFEKELAKGRTINEIRDNPAAFTRQIYALMQQHEHGLSAHEINFLDRALPDAFAFFRRAGLNPNEILPDCYRNRYASVFLLDQLPYQRDGVRNSDDETAEYLEKWILQDYQALGYGVIRVPVIPPEERVAFVIGKLAEQGLP